MLRRTTIRDVALRSGFSLAAISLALRNHPRIPKKTRTLIQKTARAMGYHPDPFLANLAAQRWQNRPRHCRGATMAIIAEQRSVEGLAGIRERAALLGYRLELFLIAEYPVGLRLSEILHSRGIQGVLISQVFTPGFLDTFDWSHFASVAVSAGAFRPPTHLVMPNHYQAVQCAWDHAIQLGYQRIGLVIFDEPVALDYHDRRAAFFERQAGIPAARRLPVLALPVDRVNAISVAEYQRHLSAWIRRTRPDVVLGFNEAIEWQMRSAGIRIPKDIAFVSLWDGLSNKTFTGLHLAADEVGRRAVDWMDALLRTGERGIPLHPSTLALDFVWQNAASAPDRTSRKPRARPASAAATKRRPTR